MPKLDARVAYCEEAQEDTGSSVEGVEGTRTYAVSDGPLAASRERPNTGKSRERRPTAERSGSSSASLNLTDTDSTTRSSRQTKGARVSSIQKDAELEQREKEKRRRERQRREERDDKIARAEAVRSAKDTHAPRKVRPAPPIHAATQPIVQQASGYSRPTVDNPAYFGIQQPGVSGTVRPGTRRPASYYAGQPPRPPMSGSSWQHHHPPPFPVGTFPPPMFPSPSPMMQAPMPPHGPPPMEPQGYFDPNFEAPMQARDRLKQRFQRPSSAMGGPPPSSVGYMTSDFEEPMGPPLARRPSQTGRHERERDRRDMPPPAWIRRPSSAMPTTPFRPPPQAPQASPVRQRPANPSRRSVGFADQPHLGFDDDELRGDDGLFHDLSPQPSYESSRSIRARPRRGSVAYEYDNYDLVLADGRNSKRSSMYGSAALGGGGVSLEDDHVDAAMRYQDRVNGGKLPLTEKFLREASKRGGVPSSRSTRSSESRDESEYKRSNTTGFTRSSSGGGNPDDYTIKVSGAAFVRAQGVEIECNGGEITVSAPNRSRSGSDRGSTIFPQIEDSHSRVERRALPHRTRAPSQADSQSRYAPYEPGLAAGNFF